MRLNLRGLSLAVLSRWCVIYVVGVLHSKLIILDLRYFCGIASVLGWCGL